MTNLMRYLSGANNTVGCETPFRSACRSARDETQFDFQNDLPVRFNFQMFPSRLGASREIFTVNLRVLPCRLSLTIFTFRRHSQRWTNLMHSGLLNPPPGRECIAAEMRVAHDLGSSRPEIATRYGMSEKTPRSRKGEL
jgi:hypothetical protein